MRTNRRTALAQLGAMGAFAMLPKPAPAAPNAQVSKGATILTVAGKIGVTNRGPAKAETVGFFKHHNITFDAAMAFDRESLLRLPQRTLAIDTPEAGRGDFAGPPLLDILKECGAEGAGVRLMALDGFAVDVSAAEIAKRDWTLCLSQDGKPFGIGDLGPLWLMHTPANGVTSTEDEAKNWVWSVFYIEAV